MQHIINEGHVAGELKKKRHSWKNMTHDSVLGYGKTNMLRTVSMRQNILWCDGTIAELISSDTKHFVWQN